MNLNYKSSKICQCNLLKSDIKCQMLLIAKYKKMTTKLVLKLDEGYFNILHSIYRITSCIFYKGSMKMRNIGKLHKKHVCEKSD